MIPLLQEVVPMEVTVQVPGLVPGNGDKKKKKKKKKKIALDSSESSDSDGESSESSEDSDDSEDRLLCQTEIHF